MNKSVKFSIQLESNGDKVLKELAIDAEDFRKAIEEVTKTTKELEGSISRFAQTAVILSSISTIIQNMSSSVGQLAESYNRFDTSMRAVNTMAGLGREGLSDLTAQVEKIAAVVPLAKDQLANGLYQTISNGVPQDNWITFLEQSAKASVGGLADLGQTVTVTSTIIKNYGLGWEEAGSIQDKIQLTAKNGVTSFEQLAAALPRVTGSAATLGVQVDELFAAFATLTGVTGNTAEVSTQLGAILTALTKPSSEATEMARQMGVQFDAAAIKAAGGMQNFLTSLDTQIKAYASAHGQLDQEIYGKLFGSAEALRALTVLNGELADKFGENVDAMADSAGTIEACFDEMAGSGESMMQVMQNNLSTMMSWAGSVASSVQPYVEFAAQLGEVSTGLIALGDGVVRVIPKVTKYAASMKALAAQSRVAAVAVNGLKIAMKSILPLLAVAAVVEVISRLTSGAEQAAVAASSLTRANEAYKTGAATARTAMNREIASLGELIKQNKVTAESVEKLNKKYGESFGVHKTASEWYDTLIRKSKAYCRQKGYEAKAATLADEYGAAQVEYDEEKKRLDGMQKPHAPILFPTAGGTVTVVDAATKAYQKQQEKVQQLEVKVEKLGTELEEAYKNAADAAKEFETSETKAKEAADWRKMSVTDLERAVESQTTLVKGFAPGAAGLAKEQAKLEEMRKRLAQMNRERHLDDSSISNPYDGKQLIANAQSYRELGNNITYYQTALEKLKPSEVDKAKRIGAIIGKLKDEQTEVAKTMAQYSHTTKLDTLKEIADEISWQKELREQASADEIAAIDKEIKRLTELQEAVEDAAREPVDVGSITTYRQLQTEISYYEELVKRSSGTVRDDAQKQVNALRDLETEWNKSLASLRKPAEIGQLGTISKLEEAITYYSTQLNDASASEIAATRRTIAALERKRDALQRITTIVDEQLEAQRLAGLTDKELKMELKLTGADGFRSKVQELKRMLADSVNPLNDSQRKEVEALIATYRRYAAKASLSIDTVGDAWGGVKGISSGIEDMTDALRGNNSAWEKTEAVIDGAIQLYQSVSSIVRIVASVAEALGVAKDAERAATIGTTAAVTAGMTTDAAAAAVDVTSAAAAESAFSALAAAKTFAAHAYIPFTGTAIAAGFIAEQQALIRACSIPKFADGGIAYGPTLGLFGEYAGASNNPEVVAPLDRLRSLIGPTGGMGGEVTFRIEGRTLVGVLNKEVQKSQRI
jgi:TP901 family phage tail tape measure protein